MTKHKEPADVAVLAARIMLAGCGCASRWRDDPSVPPPVSPYTAASFAERLCAIERAQSNHALALVNGAYSKEATETTVEKRILDNVREWKADLAMPCEVVLGFDPGGPMVSLKLPGEPEAVTV